VSQLKYVIVTYFIEAYYKQMMALLHTVF